MTVKREYDFASASAEYSRVLQALAGMHDGVLSPPAKQWNRLFVKLDAPAQYLREFSEGRAFISSQMDDRSATVRLSAAAASIFWDEERAREVLGEIRDGPYGLQRVSARTVLSEFERGGLRNLRPTNPTWQMPPSTS